MTAKLVPEHISDERLAEVRRLASVEENDCLRDGARSAAQYHADVGSALTELQHRREAEAGTTWPPLVDLGRVLGFFASVIKSGEPWSETCQREYEAANAALQAVYAASPSPPASGVRVIETQEHTLMGKEQELPLDPAYTDGPYYVVDMPINANGTGPEMDPAKVQITLYEVWNGHCLSLGQWPSRALAQLVADALNRRSSDEQAEVVGMTADEQRIMHQSLRSSVKIVASPAVAKGGVTEEMVRRAIAAHDPAPVGGNTNYLSYTDAERMRRALTAALAVGDEGSWQIKLIAEPDSGEAVNTYHATSPSGKVLTVFAANEAEAISFARRHRSPPSRGEGE